MKPQTLTLLEEVQDERKKEKLKKKKRIYIFGENNTFLSFLSHDNF